MASYDESVSGDLSDDRLAPTELILEEGNNIVSATQSASDDDFLRIVVPTGFALSTLVVQNYVSSDNTAFLAVQFGSTFTEDTGSPDPGNIDGGGHYGAVNIGEDILDDLAASDPTFIGFSTPLGAGEYTFWFNQTGVNSTTTFNFVLIAFGPTAGDDSLTGTDLGDEINGLAGDDTISGLGGDDQLIGDTGDDILRGQDGADSLFGGFGADRADGGAGNDFIRTGPDNDTLIGGAGDDTLGASNRTDLLRGGDGADLMLGSNGNDRLFGDSGSDTLLGGNGRDTIEGGDGDDRVVGNGGNDRMRGGVGNDTFLGGAGSERFAFISGEAGDDVILDFAAGAGSDDVIVLLGYGASLDSFADVIAAAVESGGDTIIALEDGATLTLTGVAIADLHDDDFVFG